MEETTGFDKEGTGRDVGSNPDGPGLLGVGDPATSGPASISP